MPQPRLKKKSRKTAIIIVSAVVTILVAGTITGILVYSNSPSRRLQKQLDLGNRYLSDLDYEQAVAAYEAALTIDPKSAEAYQGLADIHIKNGAEDELYDVYLRADGQLDETAIGPLRDKVASAVTDSLERMLQDGNYEGVIALSDKWKGLLPGVAFDEYIVQANDAIETAKAQEELLKQVYEIMSSENYLEMVAIDGSDEADAVMESMKTDFIIYAPDGADESYTGKVSGLYKIYRDGEYRGYYFYYGDVVNGIRDGYGVSCWLSDKGYEVVFETYEGEWKNDKPNGKGRQTEYWGDGEGIYTTTVEGTYKDGLQHGTFTWVESDYSSQWEAVNGDAPMVDVEAVRNGPDSWAYEMYMKPRGLDQDRIIYTLGFYDIDAGTRGVVFLTYDPHTEYLGALGFRER
ncbi:MAG: tetratricopeptide repeat protein [Lachnospiraceae bacterium]|nr:tetratricopeptide repeat protein [Lachnospiraceae bacterium]